MECEWTPEWNVYVIFPLIQREQRFNVEEVTENSPVDVDDDLGLLIRRVVTMKRCLPSDLFQAVL